MNILSSEKADTEGIDTIILISITIIGIGLITLVGVPSIFKMQEMANLRNAEQAFTVLDSHTSRVSLGESRVQNTDINLGGGSLSVVPNSSERSYVLVELKDGTSTVSSISLDMGKIVYRLGDRELGYEGGGVWSKYLSGSVMVSPPEVHYNGMTLTLPVVNVSGKSSYGGKGRVSMSAERIRDIKIIYPTRDLTNPISQNVSQVVINIYSSYYDAWADFFTGITFARVERNASEKKVTINLETPPVFTNFSYGALASDQIILTNNANIESYNSSIGGHLVSSTGNGSIRANNLIRFTSAAVGLVVNGSAISGVTIDGAHGCTTNKCKILKDAYARSYTGTVNVVGTKNTVTNDLTVTVGDAATKVSDKINSIKSNNNNALPCINGNVIDASWAGDTCTISNGNYYLTGFTLNTNNKNLVFDTSSGEINIGVSIPAGEITLKKANISVRGDKPVKIWLDGGIDAGSGSDNVQINRYGNTNDTSSLFQVVSSSYRTITFEESARYCGFVYAPRALIEVKNGAEIFGALVGNQFIVRNSQEIYFDEALQNLNTELGEGVTIMYMHITQNDIGVSFN